MADGTVRIKLNIDGANKVEGTIKGIERDFQSAGRSIGNAMSSIGSNIANVGAMATAGLTVPIIGAVSASISEFAKLEQSIGGVETLFKDNAGELIANADRAFQTAGVSANSYMEQATSFSATLLQGLGGDTKKAVEYADTAIIDMSDNANKMGTNIGMIQQAYQGFAKGNFTMLDNLKLGYGGTQGEMARLVNESGVLNGEFEATAENVKDIPFSTLIDAIHKTQEELGITGTTAKEANETISGSFQSMLASGQNLLGGLSQQGADVEKLMDNFVQTVEVFAYNISGALKTLWDNLPIPEWGKWLIALVAVAGPIMLIIGNIIIFVGNLVSAVSVIGSAFTIVSGAVSLTTGAVEGATGAIGTLAKVFTLLTGPIGIAIGAIIAIGAMLVYLYNTNEEFRSKVQEIWTNITLIFQEAVEMITTIVQGTFDILINWWNENQAQFFEIVSQVWGAISDFFIVVFTAIGDIINAIWQPISDWFQTNQEEILNTIEVVWGFIGGYLMITLTAISTIFTTTFNIISAIITTVMPYIQIVITLAMDVILQVISIIMAIIQGDWDRVWQEILETGQVIWTGIVELATLLWTNLKDFLANLWEIVKENFMTAWNAILLWFQELPGKISAVFTMVVEAVTTWVTNMAIKAQEVGTNFVDKIGEFFNNLPYKIGYALGVAIATVALWVVNMINKAIEVGSKFISSVSTWFSQLPGRISAFITNAYTRVVAWATNMWNKARETGQRFVQGVITFVQTLPSRIQTWLTSTISRLTSWVSNMGSKGRQAGQDLTNKTVSAVTSLPSKIASAGVNVVKGFWNGISSMGSWITSKVKGFFDGIVDGVTKTLGIKSPSRVFRDEVGKWIPLGTVVGIEAETDQVQSALQDMVNLPKVSALMPEVKTPGMYTTYTEEHEYQVDTYDDTRVIELLEALLNKNNDLIMDGKVVGKQISPVVDQQLGKYGKQIDGRRAKQW